MSGKNILIIGNGGREYAIARAIFMQNLERDSKDSKDSQIQNLRRDSKDYKNLQIFFTPQNPAATHFLNAKHFTYTTFDELLQNIKKHNINLVIIGPEAPIVAGVSDFLRAQNILVFAPSHADSKLESSKAYMKALAKRLNIPTARFKEFSLDSINEANKFIESLKTPIVLKASGLCGGKGVLILDSKIKAKQKLESMLNGSLFGEAGKCVVIEEHLAGYELSIFALSNGRDYTLLPACQDHKRLLDNDKGGNTGGMGAYTPLPASLYDSKLEQKIKDRILTPTFEALKADSQGYKGVLFGGIMVVDGEPYLLEYNVRFGDPECEVLMPLIESSVLNMLESYAKGESAEVKIKNKSAVCVVISSGDYALDSNGAAKFKGMYPAKITFKDFIESNLGHYIFANVSVKNNEIYANSGRALLAVGIADSIESARENAYKLVSNVEFAGMHYRTDIAFRALCVN